MNRDEASTARERLSQASLLTLSALELVRSWTVDDAGAELVRRHKSRSPR